jgi:hypothetical protein
MVKKEELGLTVPGEQDIKLPSCFLVLTMLGKLQARLARRLTWT